MDTTKPILEIHADTSVTKRELNNMKIGFIALSFLSAFLGALFVYVFVAGIEKHRVPIGFACLATAFYSWIFYRALPVYEAAHIKLPILYSFYKKGFLVHRNRYRISWELIHHIDYSKKHINLHPFYTTRVGVLTFTSISPGSVNKILRHIQEYAPERLSKRIKNIS